MYNIMKCKLYRYVDKNDSAVFYLNKVIVNDGDTEIKILKFLEELSLNRILYTGVGYDRYSKVFEYINLAEKHKSKFTSSCINQMAEVYYSNNKFQESLYYNNLYFKNSPNKDSIWLRNNYYYNQFAIAFQMKNVDTMKVILINFNYLQIN
ncbi:hypothetical protein [Chryseobacterium indoltheticum]|uniref:hypothetical protein n=1 Tax=Chryseobacterium indoltheticum TaxID=254 RepID=UPI003F498F8E